MIVVDIETSGVDPNIHSILSIGAVDFQNPKRRFYGECNLAPWASYTHMSLSINGFTKENIFSKNKCTLKELLKSFLEWTVPTKVKTFAGYNPRFDAEFVRVGCEKTKIRYPFGFRTVDLHTLSYALKLIEKTPIPLSDGVSHLGLNQTLVSLGLPKEPKPHNALCGAMLTAEAFSRILFGKSLLNEYNRYPVVFPYFK